MRRQAALTQSTDAHRTDSRLFGCCASQPTHGFRATGGSIAEGASPSTSCTGRRARAAYEINAVLQTRSIRYSNQGFPMPGSDHTLNSIRLQRKVDSFPLPGAETCHWSSAPIKPQCPGIHSWPGFNRVWLLVIHRSIPLSEASWDGYAMVLAWKTGSGRSQSCSAERRST